MAAATPCSFASTEASWFRRLADRSSGQQVEDVLYDMGRDYDVMNRQREGVVGTGIIKR